MIRLDVDFSVSYVAGGIAVITDLRRGTAVEATPAEAALCAELQKANRLLWAEQKRRASMMRTRKQKGLCPECGASRERAPVPGSSLANLELSPCRRMARTAARAVRVEKIAPMDPTPAEIEQMKAEIRAAKAV